jgi:hypothetical protein
VVVEWMGPALAAYRHRADLKELLTSGLARLLGKGVSLAFTGMQGVGKTVLLDHLTGKAERKDYTKPLQSQALERGIVRREESPGRRIRVSVVPGQNAEPRHVALDQLFRGKNPVQGVVHVVSNGYASTRNEDSARAMVRDLRLTTLAKYRNYQIERELEDLGQTCEAIRASHRKHHAPGWLLVAVDKVDLYHDRLPKAREYYSSMNESPFTERLRTLARQVGEDFFRWEVAPVCGVLEEFTWNGKVEAPQIDQGLRDAYLAQFLELLRSYCG